MSQLAEAGKFMKICVLGLGYIGLPTACLLAKAGHDVVGYDVDEKKLEAIAAGKVLLEEKGFLELLAEVGGRFKLSTKILPADVFIICVPTPVYSDHKADSSYVFSAARSIVPVLQKGNVVIVESTVPPETTDAVAQLLQKECGLKLDTDFSIAHCPERGFPGNLLFELVNNDRIIGANTEQSQKLVMNLYRSFCVGQIFSTNCKTAEFVKILENTYRGINIAFANETALLSEKLGINVWEAISLANKHPRVKIAEPGAGVGGHCIPIDPWFVVKHGAPLIKLALKLNEHMPQHMIDLTRTGLEKAGKRLENSKVVVLGVAYKPNVADCRDTPALPIVAKLNEICKEVRVHDPLVKKWDFELSDFEQAIANADAIVLVTAHDFYKELNWNLLRPKLSKTPVLIDGRNVFKQAPEGFVYLGVGNTL
jgi:UDP-N-acetyl-D-mannosaminuronic acid dehydrogenase